MLILMITVPIALWLIWLEYRIRLLHSRLNSLDSDVHRLENPR